MTPLDLARAVRGVDAILRYRQGIGNFTEHPECVFRISPTHVSATVRLSDGVVLREGEPAVELHWWNEHVPAMPDAGPSAGWALRMARQVQLSLALLARHLAADPALGDVVALTGAAPLSSRIGRTQMARTGGRFGFDVLDEPETEFSERLHRMFDCMWVWGLGWTFNRPAVRGKALFRHRYRLWMSRETLRGLYDAHFLPPRYRN